MLYAVPPSTTRGQPFPTEDIYSLLVLSATAWPSIVAPWAHLVYELLMVPDLGWLSAESTYCLLKSEKSKAKQNKTDWDLNGSLVTPGEWRVSG